MKYLISLLEEYQDLEIEDQYVLLEIDGLICDLIGILEMVIEQEKDKLYSDET